MKSDNDTWVSASNAVDRIRARLNVSVGKAQKILSDASEEVRHWRTPGKIWPAHVDPDVSLADLESWLDEHYPIGPKRKKVIGLETLTQWALKNVDQTRWYAEARKAHPQHHIPDRWWREVWKSSVPDSQKLQRGQKPGR